MRQIEVAPGVSVNVADDATDEEVEAIKVAHKLAAGKQTKATTSSTAKK